MDETAIIWFAAGFIGVLAVKNIYLFLKERYATNDDCIRELNEVLNNEEFKVKGRFE